VAFLKRKKVGRGVYLYVVRSYREGAKVREEVIQYLGNEKEWPRADADAAVAHWNRVEARRRGRGAK
jgi:hypothetical protein